MLAAGFLAIRVDTDLAQDLRLSEIRQQSANVSETEILAEDLTNLRCFHRVDVEPTLAEVIAERNPASHPHTLRFRSSDFVPNALARHFTFKLRERQKNVQGEATHRSRRVELLRDGDEGDAFRIKLLDKFGKVGQRTCEPIDLVHHDRIHLAVSDVGHQFFQSWPIHIAARESAVIVLGAEDNPSFVLLRMNIRLASLALCIERIKGLVQTFFGGFASIDRALDARRHAASSDLRFFKPKNAVPDQRVPVMSRAISERLRYFWPSNMNPLSRTMTSCSFPCHWRTKRVPGRGPELPRAVGVFP